MKKEEAASDMPKQEERTENSQKPSAGFKYEELTLSIPEMLKAGVHFGHKNSRWNPKMKPYIFGVRNGVHIIDLEKTLALAEKAMEYVGTVAANGGKILFVGTKPQAREIVKAAALAADMPYVSNRWLGGTFTNFNEIKKRLRYLNDQEGKFARGELGKYTKYEQGRMKKEIENMNEKMGGIKKMDTHPQLVFAVDLKEDNLAIKEARRAKIPVVAIADTNSDPTVINYPIPGNDDAVSSLRYILGITAKTIKEAKSRVNTAPPPASPATQRGEADKPAAGGKNDRPVNKSTK